MTKKDHQFDDCVDYVNALEGNKQKEKLEMISEVPQKDSKKKGVGVLPIIIFIVFGVLIVMLVIPMLPVDYTTRKRVAEGLVLASTYKNIVVDNAVNGFPFAQGASKFSPTVNTKNITIDDATGKIFIVTDPDKARGIVLVLIPKADGKRLLFGSIPQGQITWECKVLSLGTGRMNEISAECRTQVGATL